MRAERLYAFFYLTLRPNSGKEQKSLQKESQNRLNTGEKKIRVTLLSPLCVSSRCSLRPFQRTKSFARGENKKKGKKKKSSLRDLRERRENNRRRDIASTSKFLKRGARARILSLLPLTREEKVFSLASSSRKKEEEGLEGAFSVL